MATLDLSHYHSPISADAPCGADLDEEGDLDYMNFVAAVEGRLPTSFFSFDRGAYDFDTDFEAIAKFSADTHDIRLLVIAAKLTLLNRSLAEFGSVIETIGKLMTDHWDDVHPKAFDGDYAFRLAALTSLDDIPVSILPLTYAPITVSRRHGAISYRSHMVATGEASAREGEANLSLADIQQAMAEAQDDVSAAREAVIKTRDGLSAIRKTVNEHAGYDNNLELEKLPALVDKIADFIGIAQVEPIGETAGDVGSNDSAGATAATSSDMMVTGADPALVAAAHQVTIPAGAVTNQGAVTTALEAIDRYYAIHEPSSPAVLLVRQARRLVGKSFLEALEILAPQRVDDTIVQLGGDDSFVLPSNHLKALSVNQVAWEDKDGEVPEFEVTTRADAVQLMMSVESYYRAAEPSSAIPMLISRARSFASKDFVALLADFLPSQTEEEAAASIAAAASAPPPSADELAVPEPKTAKPQPAPTSPQERRSRRTNPNNDPALLKKLAEQNARKAEEQERQREEERARAMAAAEAAAQQEGEQ